ncbi:glycosyl transferase [Bacillus canaveralius]|uniref:Glycosyl transferase n=1 Tax=Bacillus canaveralius TaxID=1403243 RepID=A0A2N5GQA2_9BACI|nr:glycosyltransferase [Bacillus canaveralius]PLR85058.1 glycosyl transferase [Bacillus canaveralius]PLS00944.1 glycosyl transferase [Bacillus canaveralius]RSK54190.1 glycosyltransferase [Bacillus canaveralius]
MKVLQINTYYEHGSTGRLVEQLLKKQKESGIEGYVMYGRSIGEEQLNENVIKINSKTGFLAHKYKYHLLGRNGFYSKNETKRAVEIIDEINPDIVHLHNIHGYYINIEILFKYLHKKNIPVVWTFHDCWPFTGHCNHFHSIGCEKWKTGCFSCPLKTKGPRSIIFDRSKESYEAKRKLFSSIKNMRIVTVSNWLNELVKESFLQGISSNVIYNWINRSVFNEDKTDETFKIKHNIENKFVILGVAPAWTTRKGISDFLELAKIISEDEIIVLVGSTLENKLFGEKPVKNLPKNIISIPPTKNASELALIYKSADVFINPSREETFGLTTAEALSCGTPAIVYDTTACPEVVGIDETSGYIAKPFDVQDLYSKVKLVKTHGKLHFSRNAISRVNKLFNKEKNLSEYLNIYTELVKNKG